MDVVRERILDAMGDGVVYHVGDGLEAWNGRVGPVQVGLFCHVFIHAYRCFNYYQNPHVSSDRLIGLGLFRIPLLSRLATAESLVDRIGLKPRPPPV